jgi:hypothetical protein
MKLFVHENKGIAYEAFLLLSLFIFQDQDKENKISDCLITNKEKMIDKIEKF